MKGNMIRIGNRYLGRGKPVFIVAELSCNHLQDFKLAVKTIRAMRKAGADAVKLQTYTPESMTIDSKASHFQIKRGTLWDGMTLFELYTKAYTPWEWHPKLKKVAEQEGLTFFSSPFDKNAVDFLEKLNVPAYKIASFEITDIPLIEHVASKGKPVLIATGVAKHNDITDAVAACKRKGNSRVVLLKCTSAYPAPLEEMNLNLLPRLSKEYGCLVGVSDHTRSTMVPAAAVALGACVVEKHFILDRKIGGPDAPFSLEPEEFAHMVKTVRDIESALGNATYVLSPKARCNRAFCRSLFALQDIAKGEMFSTVNIGSIRPAGGLAPKYMDQILGKKAAHRIPRGSPLRWGLVK